MSAEGEPAPARALRRAATLWADDACARGLGMVVVEVAPERAVVDLTIAASMANGFGTAHGGMIFALAESAFGFAANSGADDHVAAHAAITFLKPVAVGARLRAEAALRHPGADGGVFDVTVTDETGDVVAAFRGHSRRRDAPDDDGAEHR